jgi:uncharacterized protein YodC (DUF2158 family)
MNIGDIVMLKSLGPSMTVVIVSPDHNGVATVLKCAWFVGSELRTGLFPIDAVKMVGDSAKAACQTWGASLVPDHPKAEVSRAVQSLRGMLPARSVQYCN